MERQTPPLRSELLMDGFAFESRTGARVLPSQWLMTWSSAFNPEKFPEDVYLELIAMGAELSDADFEVLGAWKDGALRHGVERKFGTCSVAFTGSWKPNAVAAYTVWRDLPRSRSTLRQHLDRQDYRSFLDHLAKKQFTKAAEDGPKLTEFGLSRATYVLHVFSRAKFPIYDSNTQAGIHFLTRGRYGIHTISKGKSKDADWYLKTFCNIIRDLQEVCAARDLPSQRALDKALFSYGKARRRG
jgi:hypothetical protein